eukprot:2053094-Amphidinium_carterae.1
MFRSCAKPLAMSTVCRNVSTKCVTGLNDQLVCKTQLLGTTIVFWGALLLFTESSNCQWKQELEQQRFKVFSSANNVSKVSRKLKKTISKKVGTCEIFEHDSKRSGLSSLRE